MPEKEIFVFGSNLGGRHGRGAAKTAKISWNAEYGVGTGRTGDAYAIPTKDKYLNVLSLFEIKHHVKDFINYAEQHPELKFLVTKVGTGLAGYSHDEIAPLFKDCPVNCELPEEWVEILKENNKNDVLC